MLDCDKEPTDPNISPPELAQKLIKWLNEHGLSQSMFAKHYMERPQGTASGYLTSAPKELPAGMGKVPLLKIHDFLTKSDVSHAFLESVKG